MAPLAPSPAGHPRGNTTRCHTCTATFPAIPEQMNFRNQSPAKKQVCNVANEEWEAWVICSDYNDFTGTLWPVEVNFWGFRKSRVIKTPADLKNLIGGFVSFVPPSVTFTPAGPLRWCLRRLLASGALPQSSLRSLCPRGRFPLTNNSASESRPLPPPQSPRQQPAGTLRWSGIEQRGGRDPTLAGGLSPRPGTIPVPPRAGLAVWARCRSRCHQFSDQHAVLGGGAS